MAETPTETQESRPRVTVSGNAEDGWIIDVHDGERQGIYMPAGKTEEDAMKAALKLHRDGRPKLSGSGEGFVPNLAQQAAHNPLQSTYTQGQATHNQAQATHTQGQAKHKDDQKDEKKADTKPEAKPEAKVEAKAEAKPDPKHDDKKK